MGRGNEARIHWSRPFLLRSGRGAICIQVSFISGISQSQELMCIRSLSIEFDDTSLTIRVTGKPLRWGDRHFPAPTELIIGRAPPDVIMTPRSTSEQNGAIDKLKELYYCLRHPRKCADALVKKLTIDIDTTELEGTHIDFNGKDKEAHKKYWPPE